MKKVYCVGFETDAGSSVTWTFDQAAAQGAFDHHKLLVDEAGGQRRAAYRWELIAGEHHDEDAIDAHLNQFQNWFDLAKTERYGFDFTGLRQRNESRTEHLARLAQAIDVARDGGVFDPEFFELEERVIDRFLTGVDLLLDQQFPDGI